MVQNILIILPPFRPSYILAIGKCGNISREKYTYREYDFWKFGLWNHLQKILLSWLEKNISVSGNSFLELANSNIWTYRASWTNTLQELSMGDPKKLLIIWFSTDIHDFQQKRWFNIVPYVWKCFKKYPLTIEPSNMKLCFKDSLQGPVKLIFVPLQMYINTVKPV